MPIIRSIQTELTDLNSVLISGVITEINCYEIDSEKMGWVELELTNRYTIKSQRVTKKGKLSTRSIRYPKEATIETKIYCLAFGYKASEIAVRVKLYDQVTIQGKLSSQPIVKANFADKLGQKLYLIIDTLA